MIISRTPFRISFFGGGTDYPVWFREHGGSVLATSINRYCYITCRFLPPFFQHLEHRRVGELLQHHRDDHEKDDLRDEQMPGDAKLFGDFRHRISRSGGGDEQ